MLRAKIRSRDFTNSCHHNNNIIPLTSASLPGLPAYVYVYAGIIAHDDTVAFPGFVNGGVRATHADMRMRINTAHLATASVLLRVQTTLCRVSGEENSGFCAVVLARHTR